MTASQAPHWRPLPQSCVVSKGRTALLLPPLVAFFTGHAMVVGAMRKRGPISRTGFFLLLAAPGATAGRRTTRAVGRLAGGSSGLGFSVPSAAAFGMVRISLLGERQGSATEPPTSS